MTKINVPSVQGGAESIDLSRVRHEPPPRMGYTHLNVLSKTGGIFDILLWGESPHTPSLQRENVTADEIIALLKNLSDFELQSIAKKIRAKLWGENIIPSPEANFTALNQLFYRVLALLAEDDEQVGDEPTEITGFVMLDEDNSEGSASA